MIIDKKILVKIDRTNINYYKNVISDINLKDIIEIDIENLQRGSNKKVKVQCDDCGAENIVKYYSYLNNIENWHIYLCSKCSDKHKMKKIYKTNLEKYGVRVFNNREKSIQTNLNKYGVENVSQLDSIKEKKKNTNVNNWGVENVFQSEKIKEISKKTKKEKYDDEFFTNREKSKQTCLKNNGVEWPTQSKEVIKTRNINNLKKYGFTSYNQTNECQNKIKDTNLKKYGKESYLSTDDCQVKSRKTCNEKYGVDYPSQNLDIHKKQFPKMKMHEIGVKYQGSYEKDFLDLCQKLKLNIQRGKTIKYYYKEKCKYYFSDYYIENINLVVEIKSSYIYELHENEIIAKEEYVLKNGYNYIMILDKNYYEFLSLINIK